MNNFFLCILTKKYLDLSAKIKSSPILCWRGFLPPALFSHVLTFILTRFITYLNGLFLAILICNFMIE